MISLVVTTYNEAASIQDLLSDVISQSLPPTEFLVLDAGSTDGTLELLRSSQDRLLDSGIKFTLLVEPGANISQGRNLAISKASCRIICVTDAGCRLDQNWVSNITQPIRSGAADFVGGFFKPVAHNAFQSTLARLTVANVPPKNFLPSSRSISFTRELWSRVGGYPEWLPWGEDSLFNELCLKAGCIYVVAKNAFVYWEVRRSYRAVFLQFYRYSLGDGLRFRTSLSYALNCGIPYVAIALTVLDSALWLFLLPLYGITLLLAASKRLDPLELPRALVLTIVIRGARFIGWHYGALVGLYSRLAGRKRR